jgi:hypothetical protein
MQVDSGTGGGTITILQKGEGNFISGSASLMPIPWDDLDGLNSHPEIAEAPLFSEARHAEAVMGSDGQLSARQVGADNALSLWLPGPSSAASVSMHGDHNAAELRAASETSAGLDLEARLLGSGNFLRLTGADHGELRATIEGDNNEFSLGQSQTTSHSRTTVAVNGDENAAQIFQDGTNLSLNLSFEGTALAPIKLTQTGTDQTFSMIFTSDVATEPLTLTLPGSQ